jgi:hypothetical protein
MHIVAAPIVLARAASGLAIALGAFLAVTPLRLLGGSRLALIPRGLRGLLVPRGLLGLLVLRGLGIVRVRTGGDAGTGRGPRGDSRTAGGCGTTALGRCVVLGRCTIVGGCAVGAVSVILVAALRSVPV